MKSNKILILAYIIVGVGIKGCTTVPDMNDETSLICGVSHPINELSWLNEQYQMIEKIPESGIVLYRHSGSYVVEVQSSLMSSTNNSQYFCDGTKLVFNTPETNELYHNFLNERVKVKILFGVDLWQL